MKISALLTALAFFASVNLFTLSQARAQVPEEIILQGPIVLSSAGTVLVPRQAVTFDVAVAYTNRGSLTTLSRQGFTPLMDILSAETVSIQLTFSANLVGQTLMAQPLDGGTASMLGGVIGVDGTAQLTFTAANQPGLCRILVRAGGSASTLRFWVENTSDPSSNPPVLLFPAP